MVKLSHGQAFDSGESGMNDCRYSPVYERHLEKPKWYFLHNFTLFYKKNAKNAIWNKYFKYFQ